MATSASSIDISKQINQAKEDFLRDVDKLRALEAMDRAQLAAAFERQAEKLIREEVQPVVQQMLVAMAVQAASIKVPPPAPPTVSFNPGGEGDLPRRVERLEGKVDKLDEGLQQVKISIATILEKLNHLPLRVEMYLAGGAAMAVLLGVMAKGFGWL
ncbi:hypothetical protein [Hydrogenophaga sp.]|uniref:hypothetical protein n=1 Tax=Hydrogenophaga sp. TaxID=1904254 RepID=UPI00272AE2B9|nr:hypothetical protein [Hydrogenophaga sp.]